MLIVRKITKDIAVKLDANFNCLLFGGEQIVGLHDIGEKWHCNIISSCDMYITILKYTGKDDFALFGENKCRIIGVIL